jgi:hypothetical protein
MGLDPQQALTPVQVTGRHSFMRIATSGSGNTANAATVGVALHSAIAHKAAGAGKAGT